VDAVPDIIVHADGRRLLVVEVTLSGDVGSTIRQLAGYMQRLLYPTGLAVVADEIVILRQNFAMGNVETVGRYATKGVDALARDTGSTAGAAYEARVQRWLASLRDPAVTSLLPEPLRGAVTDWIVPAIESGEVRAAGPRPPLAA
jgi:hypothetical protein